MFIKPLFNMGFVPFFFFFFFFVDRIFGPFGKKLTNLNINPKYLLKKITNPKLNIYIYIFI
jgi:hypothetical protein